jgi:hypothetical protein
MDAEEARAAKERAPSLGGHGAPVGGEPGAIASRKSHLASHRYRGMSGFIDLVSFVLLHVGLKTSGSKRRAERLFFGLAPGRGTWSRSVGTTGRPLIRTPCAGMASET